MSIFKCKICGGNLDFVEGSSVCECQYCGTKQTLPKLQDEKIAGLYERANYYRRNNDFDKASVIFEQILAEDNTDAEAYWSLVLCRYGVEYVEDPKSYNRIATVNRMQYTSVLEDEDYLSAIKYSDASQKEIYETEAKEIDKIQKGILAISQKEEPFDVFICYKETDNNGRRTPDSVMATDLYNELTREGYKVFFSRITLEDKLGTAYEPYIFAALNSAKVMVVIGTKPEYFDAVWVKNEWSRYLSLIKNGERKTLIPAYRDMNPYDLPKEFAHLQAQDMSKLGFMQDLIRGIGKLVGPQPKSVAKVEESGNKKKSATYVPIIISAAVMVICTIVVLAVLLGKGENKTPDISGGESQLVSSQTEAQSSEISSTTSKKPNNTTTKNPSSNKSTNNVVSNKPQDSNNAPSEQVDEEAADSDYTFSNENNKIIIWKYKGNSTNVVIPSKMDGGVVTRIRDDAFSGCSSITSIKIPDSVTSIGYGAFSDCTSLTTINIPNSVTSIGNYTFSGCKSLTTINIPNSVTSIGYSAFYSCTSLTTINIPNSVTSIGNSAFYNCWRLQAITIPNSVTSIGDKAFYACDDLTTINIANSVTSIGDSAFYSCTSLTTINIPNSVTSIGEMAFSKCSSLATINIPNSVTSIGDETFYACNNLTTINIANSVTSIGDSAFEGCWSLQTITIPNSVTSIGDKAFFGCQSLTVYFQSEAQKDKFKDVLPDYVKWAVQ